MLSKVWNEITYPFLNFNGCIVEVTEWIRNFIPHVHNLKARIIIKHKCFLNKVVSFFYIFRVFYIGSWWLLQIYGICSGIRLRQLQVNTYLFFPHLICFRNLRQQWICCRGSCQISKQYDDLNYQCRVFVTSRDLFMKCHIRYWNECHVPRHQRSFLLSRITFNLSMKN